MMRPLNKLILSGANPYFHRGDAQNGAVGCLCLHGFTASPHEVLWLGQHLAKQGYTVHAPRLAGHGIAPEALARIHWQDLIASALDAYSILQQQCDQIIVCGLSMGGLLALQLARQVPLTAAVVMAAPVLLGQKLNANQLRFLQYLRPYTDQSDTSPFAEYIKTQQQARGEPVLGRVRYDRWSTAGVRQLVLLANDTRAHLHEITAPLLLLYSQADQTVSPDHLDAVLAGVSSHNIQQHLYQHSGHILTQDVESQAVFERITDYIAHIKTG